MVLNVSGGLFGGGGLFSESASEGQQMVWDGQKWAPGDGGKTVYSETQNTTRAVADNSEGTQHWYNASNVTQDDNSFSTVRVDTAAETDAYDWQVKLMKAGSYAGMENKASNDYMSILKHNRYYGDSGDVWGVAWTPADINLSTFGIIYSGENNVQTELLKCDQFDFTIPTQAKIVGILPRIVLKRWIGGGETWIYVDYVEMTVYYTQ